MNWSTRKDIKAQVQRLWERGELLRDSIHEASRFPLRLTLKGPGTQAITHQFEAVRCWVATWLDVAPLRVEWQTIHHRILGQQELPVALWIDTLDDALGLIGKRRDGNRFAQVVGLIRERQPVLLPWLAKRPLVALELADAWPHLLAVVEWLIQHPRPAIYLRQVDIPGVQSKFIEHHRGVLAELFDTALPADQIDTSRTGIAGFATRYGFLEKPLRVRFRILDPGLSCLNGLSCPDISLDADNFSRLSLQVKRVLITENETNFLALPPLPHTMALFGSGYGWDALARARWLEHCALHYWGDIDTHGFGILDQLRGHFAHVESLLMDRATLEAHTTLWGTEEKPLLIPLHRLTADECELYDDLRGQRIRPGLRLEQEHIGFNWLQARLDQL